MIAVRGGASRPEHAGGAGDGRGREARRALGGVSEKGRQMAGGANG